MGDFGYLLRDVLEKIEYLFKLPKIEITEIHDYDGLQFYFSVEYQWMTTTLQMVPPRGSLDDRRDMLDDFINDLIAGKQCNYTVI